MVVSSGELYLSIFDDIRMGNVHDNNGSYNVAVQDIGLSKTSNFRNYVLILRDNSFSITGTVPLHTHVS